ncbi:GMC family oxidoreductase [Metabacillus idriensis]|uniref:GMC family oxidoreductase n=1 Tax=Metabacillus idriensis TaxID=324768 RepID=A0A6I2MDJ6_9BACI|nr:GMC family oxidoreductase [Metabacillus idriensis]MCM3596575.1 GMC family oxidoreductase [Metabacillus idriensis]MRX55342.1 GMC family oxidoreductase [Metabacillus idriensis]
MTDQTLTASPDPAEELKSEIVVIGSGPGGALTAFYLAQSGRDVLLIEEGSLQRLESTKSYSIEEMVEKYRNGGITPMFGSPKIVYAEGRVVGGGSEVNSGLYHRTPEHILEEWKKKFDVDALSLKDMLPHFEACEEALSVSPLPHEPSKPSLKLKQGAEKMGWEAVEVPRWFTYSQERDKYGRYLSHKQSMSKTFIPKAIEHGCKLLHDTWIKSIKQNGAKWILSGKYLDKKDIVIETEHLFICCGAVQTAALLRRSGIKQNIGNSLQIHPTLKVIGQFEENVNDFELGVPVYQVKNFAPRLSFGCSISLPSYLAAGMIDHPDFLNEIVSNWEKMAVYYTMITGHGRGTIRTIPGFRDPVIRYHLTEEDLRDLSEGLYKISSLLFEGGASAVHPSVAGMKRFSNPSHLKDIPEILSKTKTNLMTIHLFSSCPMGEKKEICAADSFGKVHGFSNLYISDASLLCSAPGVNPQGSIMAVSRRNVLKFLGKL